MDKVVIHWFRRDFRLTDNPSLAHAAATGAVVIPVCLLSTWQGGSHRWTGPPRQDFLLDCLRSLDANIAAKGGRLLMRTGNPPGEILKLAIEAGATAIQFNRAVDWHGIREEAELQTLAAAHGIECRSFNDAVLHEPAEVLTREGNPYRVFTPYGKQWLSLPKQTTSAKQPVFAPPGNFASLPVPDLSWWGYAAPSATAARLAGGEKAARQRLRAAVANVLDGYADHRDLPAGTTTSRLSQDLRFGLISIRELHARVADGMSNAATASVRRGHQVFLQELAWREFYIQILRHFPDVLDDAFNPAFRGMEWDTDAGKFDRWKHGMTGFPIVDAGMRQLRATGWMHNRVRMIVAMFLSKDLHLDWRLGEQYFMQSLVDGEIASNNGGWQWSSGTGADAAPYFRIQNPWTQTRRYDPEGVYIKSWIPELRDVPPARFLAPPDPGQRLARDYPLPMVDHQRERDITLDRFKQHKELPPV